MEPIQQLNNELDAVVTEIETLATKSDEASAAALTAARAKMASIKTRIEALQETAATKSWQGTVPAQARDTTNAVKSAAGGGATTNGVATKGTVGVTEINLMTGEIVSETGAGVLTEPQFKSIIKPDYTDAFKSWLRASGQETKMSSAASVKTIMEGVDADGGYFVPAELVAGIIKRDPAPTKIVDQVQTINVSGDRAQMIKALYDTDDLYSSAVRVYKTGEAQAARKSDKPQFGLLSIDVHGWTGELTISKRLLEDTNFDILGYIAGEFRTAQRNMSASKILTGGGVGEHFGILTRAGKKDGPDIVTIGTGGAYTYDGLQDIKFAVPEQYEQNLKWIFNKRSSGRAIAKMKDGDNRPLWPIAQQAGMVNGEPASLLGYGYLYEAFMPDIAANANSLIFGDPRGYTRILRSGMSIQVLREIEARNGQVVFLIEFREGGDMTEAFRMKVGKTT